MGKQFFANGEEFISLSKGSAFESYLSTLPFSAFPAVIGKHTFGKSLVICGDSLTAYSGGDGSTGNGFLSQINKYLGMEMTNKGYAGSNWTSTNAGDAPTRVQEIVTENIPYDVVLLAWGTNRDNNNGTISDAPSNTGSMVSVMKWAINTIRENFPMCGLGIIIPPDGVSAMSDGTKADLMIAVCREMRVPYLDLYYEGNIIQNNLTTGGLGGDQVHLASYGRNRYASAMGQFIERICPYVTAHRILCNFENVSTDAGYKWLTHGDSYNITLTADSGYTLSAVSVTMGGEDMTDVFYADGVVSIVGCSGDVVITAKAT